MSAVKQVDFEITGLGALVYNRPVFEEKRDSESHEALDERTWKQRCLTDDAGNLCISSQAIHKALVKAAKWLGMKLEKQKTYTSRFTSGILPLFPYSIVTRDGRNLTINDVEKFDLYSWSNPAAKSGSRVWRSFPRVKPGWKLAGSFLLTDERITQEIFTKHLSTSGLHDGLGGMRIGNGGPNGMFVVDKVTLSDKVL